MKVTILDSGRLLNVRLSLPAKVKKGIVRIDYYAWQVLTVYFQLI